MEELQKISVADSIKIITDNFNTESIKAKVARRPSQMIIYSYQSGIDKTNEQIDALKESVPEELTRYEGRYASDILTIVARCTYSVDEPA